MKKTIISISLLLLAAGCIFAQDDALYPLWLVWDGTGKDPQVPDGFRTLQDEFVREGGTALLPTRVGLLLLRASGSSQFSEKGLQWIKNRLRKYKVTIVDLRQESHGFLNGLPVSWYLGENQVNRGKATAEIEEDEQARLQQLAQRGNAEIFTLSTGHNLCGLREGRDAELVRVNDAVTEKQLCADAGLYYLRLPVADCQRPSDEDVDRFIELVRHMDNDSWLHIHSAFDPARATVFLAMFDMMHNAKYVSIEDIIKRQWLLGGSGLLTLPPPESRDYNYGVGRADFIRHFYQYCQQNSGDDFRCSWAAWLKQMRYEPLETEAAQG